MKNYGTIKHLIRLTSINTDDYNKKYMEIKFSSDDNLPLKKTLELYNMIIAVRSVFHEGNKYYPQPFLDEFLYKLCLNMIGLMYLKELMLAKLVVHAGVLFVSNGTFLR